MYVVVKVRESASKATKNCSAERREGTTTKKKKKKKKTSTQEEEEKTGGSTQHDVIDKVANFVYDVIAQLAHTP